MNLEHLGWSELFVQRFASFRDQGFVPARVVRAERGTYWLWGECGELVGEVRSSDGRGRHTTTHRELVVLPRGGVLIDNPGMRELQVWTDEEGLSGTFADVEELAAQCRFRDCKHRSEPGCAVRQALVDGTLTAGRLQSYIKLQKELRHLERKQNEKARLAEKAKWKTIAVASRKRKKHVGREM